LKYNLPTRFELTLGQFKASRIRISSNYERSVVAERPVSCHKGCHHCCRYPVLTSILEALTVYRGIVQKRLWTSILKARFEETSDRVRGLSVEVWILSQIACPLLDEATGTCLAYDSRPFSCRTVYSRSDPHLCDPSHSGGLPPVLPRKEAIMEIGKVEATLMRKHRLGRIVLPLPVAVLLAERLDKGEVDFAACGVLVWKDYILQW
jgi:Putative zinc- or iron-chelating domain